MLLVVRLLAVDYGCKMFWLCNAGWGLLVVCTLWLKEVVMLVVRCWLVIVNVKCLVV